MQHRWNVLTSWGSTVARSLLPSEQPRTGAIRLCVLGYRQLNDLVESVRAEFGSRAELQVVDVLPDSVAAEARARERSAVVEGFVSAGANAAVLRGAVSTPVTAIEVTGYDLLQALLRASEISPRVAVVTHGSTIAELEAIQGALKIDVAQRSYQAHTDARLAVRTLGADGFKVFVGPSVVVEFAEQYGFRGVLAYSLRSVRRSLEDAIEVAESARRAAALHRPMQVALNSLADAVLTIDAAGRISAMNEPMEALAGDAARWVGQPVAALLPEMSARSLLEAEGDRGTVALPGSKTPLLLRATPIRSRDQIAGALLAFVRPGGPAGRTRAAPTPATVPRRGVAFRFADVVGASRAITAAVAQARTYARAHSTILLHGETGTGKEVFAQSIHAESRRADGPFVAANCSALPESLLESLLFGYEDGAFTGGRRGGQRGLFEAAHGGTLFLDEIGDMPMPLQARLLRVLQQRAVVRLGATTPVDVDVRIIAATHRDLPALMAEDRFRADLFYRLNVLTLRLPALRERREDIEPIASAAVSRELAALGSKLDAAQVLAPLWPRLKRHDWPGNVRELENVAERLAVCVARHARASEIDYRRLGAECGPPVGAGGAPRPRRRIAADEVRQALQATNGTRLDAARMLGISRTTLWRREKALERKGGRR